MSVPPPPDYRPSNDYPTEQPPNRTSSAARTNRIIADMNPTPGSHGSHPQPGREQPTRGSSSSRGVPGADFMSNEEIRAYCEYRRKNARNEATELAMDADHLEAVLRTIPDTSGNRAGSRARARRVARWLKKAAAAQKASQKYYAMLYGTFEREYEVELRTVSRGRPRQNQRQPFGWH